jgi:hypothetical protein
VQAEDLRHRQEQEQGQRQRQGEGEGGDSDSPRLPPGGWCMRSPAGRANSYSLSLCVRETCVSVSVCV